MKKKKTLFTIQEKDIRTYIAEQPKTTWSTRKDTTIRWSTRY